MNNLNRTFNICKAAINSKNFLLLEEVIKTIPQIRILGMGDNLFYNISYALRHKEVIESGLVKIDKYKSNLSLQDQMKDRNELVWAVYNDNNTLFDIHMYYLKDRAFFFASLSTTKKNDDIGNLCKFFNLKEELEIQNPMGGVAEFFTRRYRFEGYGKAWSKLCKPIEIKTSAKEKIKT